MVRWQKWAALVFGVLVVVALAGGCASKRPQSVPADARSVAQQSGSYPVNFTAPGDGTIFVYDKSSKRMVYSGRMKQGETLEMEPKRNNIRLDGRVVLEQRLRDLNEYQVWFDEEPTAATAGRRVEVKTEQ